MVLVSIQVSHNRLGLSSKVCTISQQEIPTLFPPRLIALFGAVSTVISYQKAIRKNVLNAMCSAPGLFTSAGSN